jgi:hypothetical protein
MVDLLRTEVVVVDRESTGEESGAALRAGSAKTIFADVWQRCKFTTRNESANVSPYRFSELKMRRADGPQLTVATKILCKLLSKSSSSGCNELAWPPSCAIIRVRLWPELGASVKWENLLSLFA